MLVPIDQYKKGSAKPKASKLKFLPPKPARQAVPVQRSDIRQSENYKNAVTNADRMAQESQNASSFSGMARNFAKALPRATADTLVGTPVKFAVSAAEVPAIVKNRQFTDKTYKVPGLTPFKSYQSDYGKVAEDVVAGKKGMGSAAWELAKVPLAGLETAVIGKGLVKGGKALMGGDIKNAAANVADAVLPTNFSTRASSRTGLAPLPRKSPLPETPGTSQLKPLPPRTVPLEADRQTEIQKVVDSYNGGIKPLPKKVNPLLQEAGIPKTVKVWNKSKFSNDGAYADIPVTRKEDNITLYQGGSAEGRQFWTPDKKYAAQFGEVKEKTGSFYKIDNGNRMTDVYVEAPKKSSNPLIEEAGKYKSAEEFVRANRNTPEIKAAEAKIAEIQARPDYQEFTRGGKITGKTWNDNNAAGKEYSNAVDANTNQLTDIWKKAQGGGSTRDEILSALKTPNKLTNIVGKTSVNDAQDVARELIAMEKEEIIRKVNLAEGNYRKTGQVVTGYEKVPNYQAKGGVAETIEKIKNPLKPTGKERGFIESVRNSPEVSQDLASRVQGTYEPKANIPTQEKAQRLIFDNVQEAERIAKENIGDEGVITGNELIKHYDSIAQKAKASGDMATFEQAMSRATDITETQARNLTEAGRTVQAASTISRMSPEGMLHYINKVSKDFGTEVKLSPESTYDFMRKAEEIQNILDPRERAFKTFDLIDDLAASLPKGKGDKVLNALNLPRAIMSTGDLSAPLRQGIFTAARHPITFGKNFGKMMKYAFSEDSYRNLKADIITSPNYNLYVKHNLPLTDIGAGLTGREEAFMSNLAEKIPIFGKLAKGSNRAYTGFLNKMRVDLFDDFVNTAELNGIKSEKYFDDAAKFVGAATGRGNLYKTLEGSAPALNSIFFSPRLMASRISLINPHFYMKLDPIVRKEALKSLGAFVGTGMSILALAKANGAEVGTNPRSADFGKIKMGNTRYDIWGGFQQYARLIGQLATGEKVSTITGRESTLGQGYNAPTHKSILGDFFQSKTAPIASLTLRAMEGEKYGEKFNLPAEVLDRFLPMVTADAFDLYKEYGAKGVAGAIPGFFGVGSQTYGDQIPTVGTTEANNPTIKWRSQPGLGETILNSITGKEVSTLPKEQWNALYEERKQEQIRQAEVDKMKAIVLISGEPQYVGDTKVYLENGVVKTKKESKDKRMPLKDQLLYEEIQKRKSNPFFKP